MARKYYFKFKTFQNHTCRVDIYDADYSGTAIELSKDVAGSPGCPADSPVVIEEDNSDDLLEVVRTKTGYLRLIELTAGGLSDIFPKADDQLEVYVLIDVADTTAAPDAPMETVFHGYIQAQSFDSDYVGYLQELKIPIQSIVNAIGEQQIDKDHIETVADIFQYSFSEYTDIVLPGMHLAQRIMPDVLTPANNDYNYGLWQAPEEYTPEPVVPITKREFLEKFCTSYQLIAHEVGTMLVFTVIGYNGEYRKYSNDGTWQTNNWSAGYGNTVNMFNTNFSYADDKNSMSYVRSPRNIFLEWEDIDLPQSIDFSIAKYKAGSGNLVYLDYKGIQIEANWMSGADTGLGAVIVGDGENEMLCIDDTYLPTSSDVSDVYCWCRFSAFGTINSIHLEAPYVHVGTSTMIVLNLGNLYFNFNYDPDDYEDSEWIPYTPGDDRIFGSLATLHSYGVLDIGAWASSLKLKIGFIKKNAGISHYHLTKIEAKMIASIDKYQNYGGLAKKRRLFMNDSAKDNVSVNVDFVVYNYGSASYPTYNYFKDSQRNLTLQVRKKTSITELELLLGKMAMSATDQTNRVISTRYNVRDDIFELQIMGNQYF